MALPIDISILTLEVKAIHLSDTSPIALERYEIVQNKDLGYTKIWMEFKIK